MDEEYICPHCGKPIYDEDALRCLYCGEKLYVSSGFLSNIKYSKYKVVTIILVLLTLIAFMLLIML